MGKMAHIAPSSSNKWNYLGKKVKVEHKSSNLKGSFWKPTGFACLLYVEVPKIGDSSPIFHKEFAETCGLSIEGMNLKRTMILRDLTTKEVSKKFGPIQNKNGHNYVHNEDLVLITKVERLWMLVHQRACVPTTKMMSLDFVRGMTMELKGRRMNWALYTKWIDRE
jgi:hypothetical protein